MVDFKNGMVFKLKASNEVPSAIRDILLPGEQVVGNYKAIRDYVLFTDRRIISCNSEGICRNRRETMIFL